MPYNSVREAESRIPGVKNLSPHQKSVWLRVFNEQLKAGKDETSAIRIAYTAARNASKYEFIDWGGSFIPKKENLDG